MKNRILIRKVHQRWIADCPECPASNGFVIRPTYGLALAWTLSHIEGQHKALVMVERDPDCHEGCCDD